MSEKQTVDLKMFWYTHKIIIPKFVALITTMDRDGHVNAAPFSLGTPYNVARNNPQILFLMRKTSHTCKNILETGEFVANFPSSKYVKQIMDAAQFMPKEDNELEYTGLTAIPSLAVKPPSVRECYQHLECRLHASRELDTGQCEIIGNVLSVRMDSDLLAMERRERILAADPMIYLGDERKRMYFFSGVGQLQEVEFSLPEKRDRRKDVRTTMPWDEQAKKKLMNIPVSARQMMLEVLEDEAKKAGLETVTYEFFKRMEEIYSPRDVRDYVDDKD